jgi:ELWxxDGT repeat protein
VNDNPELVADIDPGTSGSAPSAFVQQGEWIYFIARTTGEGLEVWRSNGAGAELIADIFTGEDGSQPQELTVFRDEICFAATDGELGRELYCYKVDGISPVRSVD